GRVFWGGGPWRPPKSTGGCCRLIRLRSVRVWPQANPGGRASPQESKRTWTQAMDDTMTTAPSHPGPLPRTLTRKPAPEAAIAARSLLRKALTGWEMADLIDDSALVATELVSNAIRSDDDIAVEICPVTVGGGRFLRIEVFDSDPELPERRDGDPLDE